MKVRIDELLQERGRTRYWLAKEVGTSYASMANICKGNTTSIRFDILEKICSSLDCTPNDIFIMGAE